MWIHPLGTTEKLSAPDFIAIHPIVVAFTISSKAKNANIMVVLEEKGHQKSAEFILLGPFSVPLNMVYIDTLLCTVKSTPAALPNMLINYISPITARKV